MKIELSEKHLNIIAAGLGELPAKISYELITYIKQQIDQYNQESAQTSDDQV